MTVPAILISLVALTGITVSNANTEYIELESFDVGQCIEASYTAPTTGRTSVDLIAADGTGTVILHVNYRKEWGSRANSFILNSNIGGWGREQVVEGVVTTPGMVMALEICAQDANFSISLNGLEIAIYPYRINVNITRKVEFNSWEYDSILLTLGTGSSQLAGQWTTYSATVYPQYRCTCFLSFTQLNTQ